MNRPCLLLACATALLVSSSALALPTSTAFGAFLDAGPSLSPVGSVEFELVDEQEAQLGAGWAVMCTYVMQWRAPTGMPITAFCSLDEPTRLGWADCTQNAKSSVETIVMRVPSSPCAGFDDTGASHNIQHLVAGESGVGLVGVIQYTAASARVHGFVALPR